MTLKCLLGLYPGFQELNTNEEGYIARFLSESHAEVALDGL